MRQAVDGRRRGLLVNHEEGRPRALVRLVAHLALLALTVGALALASRYLPPALVVVLDLLGVVGGTWLAARVLDRRAFIDLGLRVDGARGLDLLAGVAAGAVAMGAIAGLEVLLGSSEFESVPMDADRLASAGVAAAFFVAVAIQEELVFRGYHIVNLAEGLSSKTGGVRGPVLAVAISSAAFGLAHVANDGATWLSTLNIAVGGGCLLSIGFLLTGDLAFSIGLHFAWNLCQCLLGMPVSGFSLQHAALVAREVHGSDWLTGGAFGPEAGALGLVGMLIGTLLALAYARARHGPLAIRLRVRLPTEPIQDRALR